MALQSDPTAWRDPRHTLGVAGERIAMAYLARRGWRILEHRFRMGRLEVDIVARHGRCVVFVEVKTRRGRAFGSPLEAVTRAKCDELVRVARAWVDRYGRKDDRYRFDVVGVTLSPTGSPGIEHVENAFWAGWR